MRNRILIGMSYVGLSYAYIGNTHANRDLRLDLISRKICIAVIEESSFVPIFDGLSTVYLRVEEEIYPIDVNL